MAITRWTKPISRRVTLPNGEVRIVTFAETGVTSRKLGHRRRTTITYDHLARFDPDGAVLVYTQHWGMLRAVLRSHGVEYEQVGRHAMKEVLCPHGAAFQRGLDIRLAEERAERKERRTAGKSKRRR